jgi:K+-transporting ATPase ATPase A chain
MTNTGIFQLVAYCLIILPLAVLFGGYIAKIFLGEKTLLSCLLQPVEKAIYKICGIDSKAEHGWVAYATAMLVFNFIGFVALFAGLMLQNILPLNPMGFSGIDSALAFNTAVSFVTNTNWQAYSGEGTMSYFSQMAGLNVQNFLSAATGIALLIAMIRAIARSGGNTIGNFYVDVTRCVVYILLPLAIFGAIFLIWQGVPQNFNNYAQVQTLEGATQIIPQGPVASQVAIKQIGTNGGGFFGSNSAHPYENPNPVSNLLQIIFMLLIPVSLPFAYGKMLKDKRQGWSIFAAMAVLFVVGLVVAYHMENKVNPELAAYGITSNMEGKEVRFGTPASIFWSVATTATSSGSVNSVHDSFMPLSGMVQIVNIMLGEVVFGGVGSGLYGMMIFIIVTVFIAGLMVGRTPEYMGKKIEAREIKLAILAMLTVPVGVLGVGAVSILVPEGAASITATGAHGLTQFLYAHASATGNNGSSFSGFNANTTYHNIALAIEMLIGRFLYIIPMLGIAGSLVKKNPVPESSGTFPTYGLQFVGLLVGIVVIVGGLTFFPVLVIGPGLEHLLMVK